MEGRTMYLALAAVSAVSTAAVVMAVLQRPLHPQDPVLVGTLAAEPREAPFFLRGLESGAPAPGFSGTDLLSGRTVRLAAPGRTLLRFWSPGCKVCVGELEEVKEAYRRLPPGVRLVTVANRASLAATRSFVERNRIDFPVIWDGDGKLSRLYGVKGVPCAFVIEGGRIERQLIGPYAGIGPALVGEPEECEGSDACGDV